MLLQIIIDLCYHTNYTVIVVTRKEDKMATTKRGRPKSDNPKDKTLRIRVDDMTLTFLDEICEFYHRNRSEVMRRLIVAAAKQEMANISYPDYPGYLFPEDL